MNIPGPRGLLFIKGAGIACVVNAVQQNSSYDYMDTGPCPHTVQSDTTRCGDSRVGQRD
jgi:hypothetical protein